MSPKKPQKPFESYGGYQPLPTSQPTPESERARKLKIGLWSVGAIGLVVFSMVWNPPSGSIHDFTDASDYVASKDSGCTNSGEGCHGEETEYADFNAYHPNADCATCHDYQGVGCIPCHSPDGHECQSCHDGTMEDAGDRTRITDPYPKGHYRETTHTATGTDMKALVRTVADGEAAAECSACHDRDLWTAHQNVPIVEGSSYAESIGCGECHNDERSNGLAQVLADWEARACEDCHTEKSSSPMHDAAIATAVETTAGIGCGETDAGCHDNTDVHSLHPNLPKDCSGSDAKGEPGCHDLALQSHEPTVTACGTADACHAEYLNDDYGHDDDRDVHSPESDDVASNRAFGGTPCGSCHRTAGDGQSLVSEHERPNNALAGASPNTCEACHNANDTTVALVQEGWDSRHLADACEACHDGGAVASRHTDIDGEHQGTGLLPSGKKDAEACATDGCHATLDLVTLHDETGCATDGCHSASGAISGSTRSCGGKSSSNACHKNAHSDADGNDKLHTAGWKQDAGVITDADSGVSATCGTCHRMGLTFEHSRPNNAISGGSGTVCSRCHSASDEITDIVWNGWDDRTSADACEACHGDKTASRHTGIAAEHAGVALNAAGAVSPTSCVRTGCHETLDVRILHGASGCATDGCHGTDGDINGRNLLTCGGSDEAKACHVLKHSTVSGDDPLHTAGTSQAQDSITDADSGVTVTCAGCHGMKLTAEHLRANASIATGTGDVCGRCHAADATTERVVWDGWTDRETASACAECHGTATLAGRHQNLADEHAGTAVDASGTAAATACMTAGCHDTLDLRVLHSESGCVVDGCHTTSGSIYGRDITSCGGSDTSTACHAPAHTDSEALPVAGVPQGSDTLTDPASERSYACTTCHDMSLPLEHARANSVISTGTPSACIGCHEANDAVQEVIHGDWALRDTEDACAACHGESGGAPVPHPSLETSHVASELATDGTPAAGFCDRAGCHYDTDVRIVHEDTEDGCTVHGCHENVDDIFGRHRMSCGGASGSDSCHRTFSEFYHRTSHATDATDDGCFGCHKSDLMLEHSVALQAGSMEGGGASTCRVCHEGPVAADNGDYAGLADVVAAIAAGDTRCVACHNSGSADGPAGVASPHSVISTATTLPPGAVWTDPVDDWTAAQNAVTGGGHNVSLPGVTQTKQFPVTTFTIDATAPATVFTWSLPVNSAKTMWLRNGTRDTTETAAAGVNVMEFTSAITTEGIAAISIKCSDCHVLDDPAGPQGAAVPIAIDPDYSQTGWANPPADGVQFDPFNVDLSNPDNPSSADPYKPVICIKCHLVYAHWQSGVPTTVTVGGTSRHGTHKSRHDTDPDTAGTQRENCIDCHVRIPHAWKRPRLLLRTVPAAGTVEGIAPDTMPYARETTHTLSGIVLGNVDGNASLSDKSCGTGGGADGKGGCGGTHAHAPAPTGTQRYWP